MAPPVEVNLVAVLVAAIVSMVIGALWYSPALFGKLYMKYCDFNEKKLKEMKHKNMTKSYLGTFIALLVMAYVLAHFVRYVQAATLVDGLAAGFWAWLGFVATVLIGSVLWDEKPFGMFVLHAGHYLVTLLVMGAILAVWV